MENYNDYLQHWGILGQKWGQRNGPPYPLSSAKMNAAERKQAKLSRKAEKKEQRRKSDVKNMSDAELDKALGRLRKEQEYENLSGKNITDGKKFVKNALVIGGTMAATAMISELARRGGTDIANSLWSNVFKHSKTAARKNATKEIMEQLSSKSMDQLTEENKRAVLMKSLLKYYLEEKGFK